MTCKGIYCNSAADCVDTACPGHPGQHCADLGPRARQINGYIDASFHATGWLVVVASIMMVACFVLIGW